MQLKEVRAKCQKEFILGSREYHKSKSTFTSMCNILRSSHLGVCMDMKPQFCPVQELKPKGIVVVEEPTVPLKTKTNCSLLWLI